MKRSESKRLSRNARANRRVLEAADKRAIATDERQTRREESAYQDLHEVAKHLGRRPFVPD